MYLPPPTLIETRKLKTHPNNPRYIRKDKMEALKRSIEEDPQMMGAEAYGSTLPWWCSQATNASARALH